VSFHSLTLCGSHFVEFAFHALIAQGRLLFMKIAIAGAVSVVWPWRCHWRRPWFRSAPDHHGMRCHQYLMHRYTGRPAEGHSNDYNQY
jgi:hypothetical protein